MNDFRKEIHPLSSRNPFAHLDVTVLQTPYTGRATGESVFMGYKQTEENRIKAKRGFDAINGDNVSGLIYYSALRQLLLGTKTDILVHIGELKDHYEDYENALRQFVSIAGLPKYVFGGSDMTLAERVLAPLDMELHAASLSQTLSAAGLRGIIWRLTGVKYFVPVKK